MVTWRLDSAPFWHTRKYFWLSKLHHKLERSVNFANGSELVDPEIYFGSGSKSGGISVAESILRLDGVK